MFIMAVIAQSLAVVVGSLLAGGILCWLAYQSAVSLHHQNWAALFVLVLLSLLGLTGVIRGELARLSALCAVFGTLFLWIISAKHGRSANLSKERGR